MTAMSFSSFLIFFIISFLGAPGSGFKVQLSHSFRLLTQKSPQAKAQSAIGWSRPSRFTTFRLETYYAMQSQRNLLLAWRRKATSREAHSFPTNQWFNAYSRNWKLLTETFFSMASLERMFKLPSFGRSRRLIQLSIWTFLTRSSSVSKSWWERLRFTSFPTKVVDSSNCSRMMWTGIWSHR